MQGYVWLTNEETGAEECFSYDELDTELVDKLLRPIGGFCYAANDFTRLRLVSAPFYVKDWLPKQGKALFFAPAKSGKSFLSAQLARCVGSGLPFLGIPTVCGRVLYVQSELSPEVLQGRLKSTGKDYENVYVGTTFSLKLDTPGGQQFLWSALDAIKPNVLILDPWYKMISGDESGTQDTRKVIDFLDSTIEAYGCSIVVIHHTGKDISKGGRGSTVLEDWVDSYIEVKRISQRGETLRIKLTPKMLRHAELPPESIEAELLDFEFVLTWQSCEAVKDKVQQFLLATPVTVTVDEMVEQEVAGKSSIYEALKELIEEGKVVSPKHGFYVASKES